MPLTTISGTINAQPLNDNFSFLNSQITLSEFNIINVKDPAYGATGDGNIFDTLSIQTAIDTAKTNGGGIVYFPPGIYLISATLTIDSSKIILQGAGRVLTQIKVNGGSIDAISFIGTVGSPLSSNGISGMYIFHTTAATAGAGITLSYTAICKLNDIQVADFLVGVTMSNATNTLLNNVIASCSSGSANFIGFDIQTNCISSVWRDCWVDASGNTGSTIGFRASGISVHDYQWIDCATAFCDYGWFIVGSQDLYAQDLHIKNPIIDSFTAQGIFILGCIQDSSVTIIDGWINPASTGAETDAIYIEGSRGVSITGTQLMADANYNFAWGVKIINSSSNTIVSNCLFTAQQHGVYILDSFENIVSSNVFKSRSGQSAFQTIYLQNTRNCVLANNVIGGYATYGVYLDTSANSTIYLGNNIVTANITTAVTNLGTGNVLGSNIP